MQIHNSKINVKDYGAVGDGVQNDTSAILKAFDVLKSGSVSSNLYFPEGTYLIDRGFNIPSGSNINGEGQKTTLLLKKGLPQRIDNRWQAAVFMGTEQYKGMGSLNSTVVNSDITIRDLCIDLQRDVENLDKTGDSFPMMGGINILNADYCTIKNVNIKNTWIYGISLFCNGDSKKDLTGNLIEDCTIELTNNWYDTPNNPRFQPPLIGIELASEISSFSNNGAGISLTRTPEMYFPSRTYNNTIKNCKIVGGSHGISLSNARNNVIEGNTISDCSNRGIILSATSDENVIRNNKVNNIGSTAIHLSYNSDKNKIYGNEVDGVLCCEGDGIKAYVNCNENEIYDNIVKNFATTGIRVAHGANKNIIRNNKIDGGKNSRGKYGIKILANTNNQYFTDNLKFDDKLTANDNVCKDNIITNIETPVKVGDEVFPTGNTFQNNVVSNNTSGNENLLKTDYKPLIWGGLVVLAAYGIYLASKFSKK